MPYQPRIALKELRLLQFVPAVEVGPAVQVGALLPQDPYLGSNVVLCLDFKFYKQQQVFFQNL